MLSYIDKISFDDTKCQQCGVCISVCPVDALSARLKGNGLSDIIVDYSKCLECKKCVRTCPANKEDCFIDYCDSLRNKVYCFAYNRNNAIRKKSTSGGACKTLIIENLKSGIINGVYSLKKCDDYPQAEGEFYQKMNIPDYDDIPNSVYHSIMIGKNIDKVKKCERLMIVGTTCQLRAMGGALKGKYDKLIKVCIFCKQQKTLDSTRFLAKTIRKSIPSNLKFESRYRGEGWPGIVRIEGGELYWDRAAQLPFGRRLWTVPGCNICGDPFGINVHADITLMDPWIIRQSNELGETLITVHTAQGRELLRNTPNLLIEEKQYVEIEPALGMTDIRRKQQLVPYFRGELCSVKVKKAGQMEQQQRKWLQSLAIKLPRMPFIFYRIMCKLPDLRNIILK